MSTTEIQCSDNFQGGVEVKFTCPTTLGERPYFKEETLLFGGSHSLNSDELIGSLNSYLDFTKSKLGIEEGLGSTPRGCSKAWDGSSLANIEETEARGSRSNASLSVQEKEGMVKAAL